MHRRTEKSADHCRGVGIILRTWEMTELMCSKEVMTKLAQIPLSNNTILLRIGCMSDDIREQVCDNLRMSPAKASMQFDEHRFCQFITAPGCAVCFWKQSGRRIPLVRAIGGHNKVARRQRQSWQAVVNAIVKHLDSLKNSFEGYFDIDNLPFELWVRDPFTLHLVEIDDNDLAKDELIDLLATETLI